MNAALLDIRRNPATARTDTAVLPPLPAAESRSRRKLLLVGFALAAIGAAAGGWKLFSTPAAPAYSTAEVRRGDLVRTISATGRVQAVTTVQVGSQVSGIIAELHADFNSRVTKGQVLARLDPSQFGAQLTQARASFQSAQARVRSAENGVLSADASVEAAQANLVRAEAVVQEAKRNYETSKMLVDEGVAAARTLDTLPATITQAEAQRGQALAQLNQARAQALSARSQLEQVRAEAQQSAASVEVAQVNLERTIIRAPINGVVVERSVDIGQTVAASLQAPQLFLIANDLTQMQVLADIDEADIGQLSAGGKVSFTVDAFPADTFQGRISQIRLSPMTVQNVVTYTSVVDVANPNLKLRPGMTANVTAVIDEKRDVPIVPNTAFRFRPPDSAAAAPGPARRGAEVWVVSAEGLKPVRVRTGATDGINTEILGESLQEGDRVAIPQQQQATARAAGTPASSPFATGVRPGGRR